MAGNVGFRVAYVVNALSGSSMLDVAGFGFLVAVAEGDGEKPETRHRQPSKLPDHWRNQSAREKALVPMFCGKVEKSHLFVNKL